jgi:hypothetical protein
MHELVIRNAAAWAAAVLLSHGAAAVAAQSAANRSPAAKSRFDSGIYKGAFSPFELAIVDAVDAVVGFELDNFYPNPVSPRPKVEFAFYGDVFNTGVRVECERAVNLPVSWRGSDGANLDIGICRKEAARVARLARAAKAAVERSSKALPAGPRPWRHVQHDAHTDIYSFPVIWIDHGAGAIDTVVVADAHAAIIVQANLMQLCEPIRELRSALCKDTPRALTDIALRVRSVVSRP